MGKCLIIAGGEYEAVPEDNYEYIIACDKGYEYARRMNVIPDIVVGDFDSYCGEIDKSIKTVRLPKVKDDTDTVYAVRYAMEHGHKDITICCAFGGRLDHTVANIQTAAYIIEHYGTIRLFGNKTQIYMIKNSSISIDRVKDSYISVFSYSNSCSGVTLKGFKYEIENTELVNSFPLGVSNEWKEQTGYIEVKDGTVCIVISGKQ